MRFKRRDSVRPSAEVLDQYLEECVHQGLVSTSRLFGLRQDTVLSPVICSETFKLDDVLRGPGHLLVDLDDQSVSHRRPSAAVIEQALHDFTQQPQRDPPAPRAGVPFSPGYSSVISVQYHRFEGTL